jgi:integrase
MPDSLPVPQQPPVLSAEIYETMRAARRFEELSRAENTRRAYQSDWADFEQYCERHNFPSLPSTDRTIELYISYLAYVRKPKTLNQATIGRRLAAIAAKHRDAGFISPTEMPAVKDAWKGIRRALRQKPKPKKAIEIEPLRALVASFGDKRPIDVRDRAILLMGFAGAMRRSEIAGMRLEDLTFEDKGVVVNLPYSKTNQEGNPEHIAIQYGRTPETCPVRALVRWLELANIDSACVFRRIDRHNNILLDPISPAVVALVVKRRAAAIGLDPEEVAAHSLRSGFVTTSRRQGISDFAIKRTTRHKSSLMLDRYTHPRSLWDENATGKVGL